MANKQTTAVDWLFSQLPDHLRLSRSGFEMKQIADNMFREQIEKAWNDGQEHEFRYDMNSAKRITAEQYCNQPYSLPDEQPQPLNLPNWRNDEYSEQELEDDFEETHGNSEAENCHCGAYKIVKGEWFHVSDCCC